MSSAVAGANDHAVDAQYAARRLCFRTSGPRRRVGGTDRGAVPAGVIPNLTRRRSRWLSRRLRRALEERGRPPLPQRAEADEALRSRGRAHRERARRSRCRRTRRVGALPKNLHPRKRDRRPSFDQRRGRGCSSALPISLPNASSKRWSRRWLHPGIAMKTTRSRARRSIPLFRIVGAPQTPAPFR